MRVIPVPQLSDNYAYLIIDEATEKAAVVDCAEADSIRKVAQEEGVELVAILPTHHHYDHTGGNLDLLQHGPMRVYGFTGQAGRIPGCTHEVEDGATIEIGTLRAQVIFVPAHTLGHLAYYFPVEAAVFTGDTLFAGGCGRLFEGDAAMMIQSLEKLLALPDHTQIYFGHEYTEKNLRFALTLEPDNLELRRKHEWAVAQIRAGKPTTPTTLASEKATNPFLRWRNVELRDTLRRQFPDLPLEDIAVFAKIRELKDSY